MIYFHFGLTHSLLSFSSFELTVLKVQQKAFQWLSSKESACQCRRCQFDPWVGKIPWRRKWQPTLVFLPGKSHGQKSLVGLQSMGSQRVGHDLVTKQKQQKLNSSFWKLAKNFWKKCI